MTNDRNKTKRKLKLSGIEVERRSWEISFLKKIISTEVVLEILGQAAKPSFSDKKLKVSVNNF